MSEEIYKGIVDPSRNVMPWITDAPLAFRFMVTFLVGGAVPNPLDVFFQKVSGLSATVDTMPLSEGGQNLYTHKLPTGISYGNLILERGMTLVSPLNIEINVALSLFRFFPSHVMVTLLNENGVPISAWAFYRAFPVKWSTSDLDANNKTILIDSIELAYARMQILRV